MKPLEDKLSNELDNCILRIIQTNDYVKAFEELHENIRQYNKVINLSPAFFSLTYNALVFTIMMETAKLFDYRNDVISIKNLIEDIKKKNINELEDNISCFKKELEELRPSIKNLRTQRNKILAHIDREYTIDYPKDYPVCWKDIKKLLDFAFRVCNKISLVLKKQNFPENTLNIGDLHKLLEKVNLQNNIIKMT